MRIGNFEKLTGCRIILSCLTSSSTDWKNLEQLSTSCRLSLHACNRSLFARGLSLDCRAYVISQYARWPIRTPRYTCANQDAWVVITPKRPKANSIHTAAWHAWTGTPPLNIVQKAVFSPIHFPVSFIRLWPSCRFDLVDRDLVGGCS